MKRLAINDQAMESGNGKRNVEKHSLYEKGHVLNDKRVYYKVNNVDFSTEVQLQQNSWVSSASRTSVDVVYGHLRPEE